MQSKLHQPFLYRIDQFIADDFLCGVADVVHTPYPFHLILRFQFFCHALLFCRFASRSAFIMPHATELINITISAKNTEKCTINIK